MKPDGIISIFLLGSSQPSSSIYPYVNLSESKIFTNALKGPRVAFANVLLVPKPAGSVEVMGNFSYIEKMPRMHMCQYGLSCDNEQVKIDR